MADFQDGLPELEEKKAWSVWKKLKGSRTAREIFIQSAQAKIEHLTVRLNKLRDEMLMDVWRNEHGLSKACEVLEVTVQDREEQRWMITVWKRRQEPAHVIRHGTKSTQQASQNTRHWRESRYKFRRSAQRSLQRLSCTG